jgi:fatty-acyl-CoA synthase
VGASVEPSDLKAHVRERRGALWAPKFIVFVDALPLTSLGKIDRKMLRATAAQHSD